MNAIYVWGVARAAGGRVLLRIEDHDRLRCRPIYEDALLEDLDWLGFVPDEGRMPPARQSDHPRRFGAALDALDRDGRVYACDCSRRRIGRRPYDGRCRDRGLPRGAGHGLRVRLDDGPVHARRRGARADWTSGPRSSAATCWSATATATGPTSSR